MYCKAPQAFRLVVCSQSVVQFMPSFVGYDDDLSGSLVLEYECSGSDGYVHTFLTFSLCLQIVQT